MMEQPKPTSKFKQPDPTTHQALGVSFKINEQNSTIDRSSCSSSSGVLRSEALEIVLRLAQRHYSLFPKHTQRSIQRNSFSLCTIHMSVPLTPSKRPYDWNLAEPNGKGKWQKSASVYSQSQPFKVSPGSIVFRVLCPSSKIGGVIGKGGAVISQIRQETAVKVKVEDNVPGCDDRVVVIVGSENENEVSSEQNKEHGGEKHDVVEEGSDTKENDDHDEDKESVPLDDSKPEKRTSSVQKALLLIFEKMVEGEPQTEENDTESSNTYTFILRLLVLSTQVGCLLGKAGSTIKQMSTESGAQIRILSKDKLPTFASASDELVQITGGVNAVRKALQSVSQQLLENPLRDHDSFSSNPTGPSSHSHGNSLPKPEVYPSPSHSLSAQGAPYAGPHDVDYHSSVPPIPKFHESGFPGQMSHSQELLSFRLLCPDERVGGVIGKGGTVIKALRQETGCDIKVQDGVSDSEDRIIFISGLAHPDERVSAAQDAVLRVQTRIARTIPDSKEKTVIARLLVSSIQIGCILGMGGSVIAGMRKSTGAYIQVLGKDKIPKCASGNDEVVQINGDYETVQEALLQVTNRLRDHFFRDAFPPINRPSAFPDHVPPFPSYMGRRELSPPGMYSNLGPSFHKFDAVGGPSPHGGFHPHDDPFMHHRPGMPPHLSERRRWGPQGRFEGTGPMGLPDYTSPQRRFAGFVGATQPPIITSTTVEVIVPRSIVPVLYGEDGACLKQVRQISDANITITEPKPGAAETVIVISGTPEQTHAAQSLIQAFVMCETESN